MYPADSKDDRSYSMVVLTAPLLSTKFSNKPYFTGTAQLNHTIAAMIKQAYCYLTFGVKASKVDYLDV